ncbi:CLUMA_CG013109, isoform A [Clunio marinus]|uniref:CLUMA_CG013109, isoform A n=1 Tax=Clunio marinus TaxID=568069 RepID=A0A1J1IMV2_9DIPT|nr:CLUMA_CG013109, isoform A [Clunio marinus]
MYKHQDVTDIQHQYFRKPEQLTRKEAFRRFLWNPKTRECFGRTASSWGHTTSPIVKGEKKVVAELSNLELNVRFFSTFKLLLPI